MRSFAALISDKLVRRARWVAFVGTLLGFVGTYYSVQLYKNLRTNFEELLPLTARSVIDLNEVTRRLESIDNLAILVFSENPPASKRFVMDLADRLDRFPKDQIASVEYRIHQELEFFKKRQALYMEVPDLEQVRDYIGDRISYEKELYNPLNIFSEREIPEPKLDLGSLRDKYQMRLSAFDHFPDGYYATPDEKIRVLLVNIPGKNSDIGQIHALKEAVVKTIADLKPEIYSPDLKVAYTGGVQDTLEENAALIADLELSTVIVIVLISLAMLLFYRSVLATSALVFSLFMGTFLTFGVSFFLVGYLNANSAFLGSIVMGNGINFGIIYLARYLEERRQGIANDAAVQSAARHTATATWTAALAAGLSYGSLMLTGFRGFNQFGAIGLCGMVLCWLSSFTLLPAYLTVLDRIRPLVRGVIPPPRFTLAGGAARLVGKFPRIIWGISLAATLVAAAMFTRYNPSILETNLAKLRNRESLERGSAFLSGYLDKIFQRYLSPLVILPHNREDARRIARNLKERKKREGQGSMIASVQTLDDFLPQDQTAKIAVLKQIRGLLPPRILSQLSENDRHLVQRFLEPEAFRLIREDDLPPLIVHKFTEKDGSVGKLVLVEPPLTHETWQGDNIVRFVSELRQAADSVAPGTAVAGTIPITADMFQAIARDGPRATFFAFAAVVALVIILFRNLGTILLVLFALLLGVVWMAGVVLGFWIKINFLNFIALPITFGIGVDYGVNIFQRYREDRDGDILKVIRHTGGAVALCSFTTVVGYMSLLIASNQGFVSFGTLAVLGEITCVTAAIISLPAFLLATRRRPPASVLKTVHSPAREPGMTVARDAPHDKHPQA